MQNRGKMKKVDKSELYFWKTPELTEDVKGGLLSFCRNYQVRVLKYFASLKLKVDEVLAGAFFPGLFAEVDSITGTVRPPREQKVWTWGDTRGLGIWSYFLCKGVVPDEIYETINLKEFYGDYCRFIYEKLIERYELNGNTLPFIVDPATNLASEDPRNISAPEGEFEPGHIFAATGFSQYGILCGDMDIFKTGMKFLEESYTCGFDFRNVDHITKKTSENHAQGFLMVTLGAIVDILKCLKVSSFSVDEDTFSGMISKGRRIIDHILKNHYDSASGAFWEYNTPEGTPYVNDKGYLICDPGHTAEFCGFASEFCDFLTEPERNKIIPELINILSFIDEHAYSKPGVMFKNIDLKTRTGVADKILPDGREFKTAPWWNVRECSAASIKLYQLSGDSRCLEFFRKAYSAAYLNYPNALIGGLMVQTLDAETLEPLPFNPATGNLDPMHSPRAREHEIEALGLI